MVPIDREPVPDEFDELVHRRGPEVLSASIGRSGIPYQVALAIGLAFLPGRVELRFSGEHYKSMESLFLQDDFLINTVIV